MFCHTEYNCEAFLGCELVCDFLRFLIQRMLLDRLCTGKVSLWCVFGYVQLSYLLCGRNIHILHTERLSQSYGSVCGCIMFLDGRMFLHIFHM
jgi:hypothetical protein